MICNARIIQPTTRKDCRVVTCVHVVVRRVLQHACCIWFNARVAPLFPLGDSEWQRRVAHGCHHINEGNFGDSSAPQFWTQVDARTNHQPAGTSAAYSNSLRSRPTRSNHVIGDCVDIIKGVALLLKAAIDIPTTTHLAATSWVSKNPRPTAINE